MRAPHAWLLFAASLANAGGSLAAEDAKPAKAEAAEVAASKTDRIWSGVVLATNAEKPEKPPAELAEFVPRLRRVFGYNQFELFGGAANEIGEDSESWLLPSKNFWLGVKARRTASKEARGGYLLNVQLFYNQRPLVDTEAKLAPGSPLFIRGPQYGKSQVIVVLQVQRLGTAK